MNELPKYKCHKEVWALKIKEILQSPADKPAPEGSGGTWELVPAEEGYSPFTVTHEYITKHNPQVGGYYVLYQDGYHSYSPAEPFESGYTLVTQPRETVTAG